MANGLVEAHNKILKTKLNKMGIQTGHHWTKLLKSAVIAMNSTKKRAHGQTAFKVMWGRESRHEELLSTINNLQANSEEDFDLEEAIFTEVLQPDDMEEIEDVIFPPLDNPKEEVSSISESRTSTQQSAMVSINFEQLKQKIQYDKKVNEGRASLEMEEKFIYTNMPKQNIYPKQRGKRNIYIGPYTASKVTDSHVTISKDELGTKKDKEIPIHITRPYHGRSTKPKKTKQKITLDTSIGINSLQTTPNLFGFTTESIFGHLHNLKEILKHNVNNATFMTPLHYKLHNLLHKEHTYTPNTLFFQFLNGGREDKIHGDILGTVLGWTSDLFPDYTDTRCSDGDEDDFMVDLNRCRAPFLIYIYI